MAKCIYCGNSGLFLRVDRWGRCPDCVEKERREEAEAKRRMKIYNEFEAALKITELKDRIVKYEKLINRYKDEFPMQSYYFNLATFYRQAQRYDDAWSILNKIQLDSMREYSESGDYEQYSHVLGKIRWNQHEVLFDEGKYLDAVRALSGYYYLGVHYPEYPLNANAYIRRAGAIARKGGLKTEHVKEIAAKIEEMANNHVSIAEFDNWFNQFVSEITYDQTSK